MTKYSTYLWNLVLAASFLFTPPTVKAGQMEIVTNTRDDGPGSLRQAILLVDDQGEVLFDEAIHGQTIVLTSGSLRLTKDMSILCPIDNRITITSQGLSRIFYQIEDTKVKLQGLNLSEGGITGQLSDVQAKGGAILSMGSLNINHCNITKSSAVFGGGIYGSTLYLSSCNISDNESQAEAGGIYAEELTAIKSSIVRNQVSGRIEKERAGLIFIEGSAGGIAVSEKLDLYQCTISENKCGGIGGGICTINGNSSKKLSIISCNISNNSAGYGGGIFDDGFVISSLSNNLIVQNSDTASSPDLYTQAFWEDISEVHHNIISVYSDIQNFPNSPGSDNQVGSEAEPIEVQLAPLQNNGGSTLTSAFIGCSLALNAGQDILSPSDQTGSPRSVGEQVDIGPWEHQDPESLGCGENPLEKYVIIATDNVILSNRTAVINGGVAVLNPLGSALVTTQSRVTAATTFVEALDITVTGGSLVTTQLLQEPNVRLPTFIANNSTASNSVIIQSGTTQTLSEAEYKDITVRTGGTVIFESNQVFIEDLNIQRDGSLIIEDCTDLIVKNRVTFGSNSKININNKRLSIFANDARIANGSTVYANIQASTEIRTRGRSTNPIFLYGLFIAPRIDSRNYVNWNWNQQEDCNVISAAISTDCNDFKANAGKDVSVLTTRFNFLNANQCVSLNGSIESASSNYKYEWTSSNTLSDTDILTPEVCPTNDTEYILNAKNENGCEDSDTVLIKVIPMSSLFNLPRCDNRFFWITMCNPISKEEVCANIFSSSPTNGVGPLLLAGYSIGTCGGLEPKEEQKTERVKSGEFFRIWPTPSYGSINFSLEADLISRIEKMTITKSDASDVYSKTFTESDFNTNGVLTINNLSSGYYTYIMESLNAKTETGKFLVKEKAKK